MSHDRDAVGREALTPRQPAGWLGVGVRRLCRRTAPRLNLVGYPRVLFMRHRLLAAIACLTGVLAFACTPAPVAPPPTVAPAPTATPPREAIGNPDYGIHMFI